MDIYKRFFDARSHTSKPLYAHLDGEGCWLAHKPMPRVIESASFRAILRKGPSDFITRRFELGKAGEYYCTICHGIGSADLINLYTSEQKARQDYEDAVGRCERASQWQRV